VREVRTRMPVIFSEEHHDAWLSGEAGKEISAPYPGDQIKVWPISGRANSPKNNDADIVLACTIAPDVRKRHAYSRPIVHSELGMGLDVRQMF
jgi:hypothetical protein